MYLVSCRRIQACLARDEFLITTATCNHFFFNASTSFREATNTYRALRIKKTPHVACSAPLACSLSRRSAAPVVSGITRIVQPMRTVGISQIYTSKYMETVCVAIAHFHMRSIIVSVVAAFLGSPRKTQKDEQTAVEYNCFVQTIWTRPVVLFWFACELYATPPSRQGRIPQAQ